jgi:ATP-dependent DNA ligase
MGLEGIVSKRKDSRYRSGRSPDWISKPERASGWQLSKLDATIFG